MKICGCNFFILVFFTIDVNAIKYIQIFRGIIDVKFNYDLFLLNHDMYGLLTLLFCGKFYLKFSNLSCIYMTGN